MIYQTASDWGKTDLNHTQGTLESHEYFHTVQSSNGNGPTYNTVPRWLVEGSATWVSSASVFYKDFDLHFSERNRTTNEISTRIRPTAKWIETFLNPDPVTDWRYWDSYENYRLYDVGALATEVMVSISGPDSLLNLFKRVGEGAKFVDAFQSEFGIPWRDAAAIIARTVAAEIK